MSTNQSIPTYAHFNQSLAHLHLPKVNENKLYHVFKWNYDSDLPIHYPASRQQYFDITFFVDASFTHHLNSDAFSMINHSLHILTPGQAEQFDTNTRQRVAGFGMYFMPDFLFETITKQRLEKDFSFLKNGNRNVYYLSPAQSVILQQIFENLISESNLFNDDIVRHYLLILLYKLKSFELLQDSPTQTTSIHNSLFSQFEKLFRQANYENTNISNYASILNVTPRTLSEAVQKETGKTAKQFLQDMIYLEAKILLLHSTMQISEIATQLNFHDTPHFTRFFIKVSGKTPLQFRKGLPQNLEN
jgi:AraC family transcriptional regulator, transcriptional activator of pobA